MSEQPKPTTVPSWLMPLLSLALSVIGSLVAFSYSSGANNQRISVLESKVAVLEADKAKRAADDAARLATFEQARAAKMAQLEAIAERLQQVPANPTPR